MFIDSAFEVLDWYCFIETQLSLNISFSHNKILIIRIFFRFIHQCCYLKSEIMWQRLLKKYRIDTFNEKLQIIILKSGRNEYDYLYENCDMWILIHNGN